MQCRLLLSNASRSAPFHSFSWDVLSYHRSLLQFSCKSYWLIHLIRFEAGNIPLKLSLVVSSFFPLKDLFLPDLWLWNFHSKLKSSLSLTDQYSIMTFNNCMIINHNYWEEGFPISVFQHGLCGLGSIARTRRIKARPRKTRTKKDQFFTETTKMIPWRTRVRFWRKILNKMHFWCLCTLVKCTNMCLIAKYWSQSIGHSLPTHFNLKILLVIQNTIFEEASWLDNIFFK
jgi:hypothetical protein